MATFTASIFHKAEKPFGVGRTAHERASRIVGGYRGEVISGLPDGKFIYTGVHSERGQVKADLIAQLKAHGFSGNLRFV